MPLSIFTDWFRQFLPHTKPTEDDPVLLLMMDGYMAHVKNLDVINLARENHVKIVIFPPHCSHRMQPLDFSFIKPLNAYYVQAVEGFFRNNLGRVVTIYKLSTLFGEAYVQAAVPNKAINGFRKTGIYPLNSNVFSKDDFLPAYPMEIPLTVVKDDSDDAVVSPIMAMEDEVDHKELLWWTI